MCILHYFLSITKGEKNQSKTFCFYFHRLCSVEIWLTFSIFEFVKFSVLFEEIFNDSFCILISSLFIILRFSIFCQSSMIFTHLIFAWLKVLLDDGKSSFTKIDENNCRGQKMWVEIGLSSWVCNKKRDLVFGTLL